MWSCVNGRWRWWDHSNHVEEVKKVVAVVTALAVEVVMYRQRVKEVVVDVLQQQQ